MGEKVKKYKLLKDLPDAKSGAILEWDGCNHYDYKSNRVSGSGIQLSWYLKEYVENSPDWFEEVKDIPFEIGWFEKGIVTNKGGELLMHCFYAPQIPAGKLGQIKKAIEDVVNGVERRDYVLVDPKEVNISLRCAEEFKKIIDSHPFYRGHDAAGEFHWTEASQSRLSGHGEYVIDFLNNHLIPDIQRQKNDHFELSYSSLTYPVVYYRTNQVILCDTIERLGFSVRCGLAHKYVGRQGLQEIVFECSKNMKFNHRFTDQINGEIKYGVNS